MPKKKTVAAVAALAIVLVIVLAALGAFAAFAPRGATQPSGGRDPAPIAAPAGNDEPRVGDGDAPGDGTGGSAPADAPVKSPKLDAGGDLGSKGVQFAHADLLEEAGFTQADVDEAGADLSALLESDGDDPAMKFTVQNGTSTDADGDTVAYVAPVVLEGRYYAIALDADASEGDRVTVSRVTDASTLPEFTPMGLSG